MRQSRGSRSGIVTGPDRSVSVFRYQGDKGCSGRFRLSELQAAAAKDEQNSRKGGILLSTSRQYRSKPTHGIGRYKHLIKEQEPKKKRGKVEVRPINLGTDYEYGVLNVHLTAYDMALAESYAQYVHNLCNHLSIKVEESNLSVDHILSNKQLRIQILGPSLMAQRVKALHQEA
ncbi:PREDICTED: 39S ribosomal protein L48, mitochondrial isoform X3 [Condylura cristata]|uniref:39S ribosomal protein L48, mitochondrial isoform X3 n=1 Tax=Condylura cristata TaxID=143302 RepID=UPI000643A0F7|nr:PREDICTED: 39S ribosomal protein L48, mitochondrial isoform X3 [Condylura cristata]